MEVSPARILSRGLRLRCPNCGGGRLFAGVLRLAPSCPDCGLSLERGEGFFLGSMALNYGVTVVALLPVLLLWAFGLVAGLPAALLALAGAVVFPALFYRSTRCWWLAAYFAILPRELPLNRRHRDDLSHPPEETGMR
ncbi:MAG: DUF983 domain-containing protein [Puniceicoccaceae bacterium]|nr:MAG: DUF983 domain-containing protein [Puniceicoccaceae bacterium]